MLVYEGYGTRGGLTERERQQHIQRQQHVQQQQRGAGRAAVQDDYVDFNDENDGNFLNTTRGGRSGTRAVFDADTSRRGVEEEPYVVDEQIPAAFRCVFDFRYFNCLQAECFDCTYRSEQNVVVSAPTGSGKTTLFELGMLRLLSPKIGGHGESFRHEPGLLKTVYLCPTKSLAQERVRDWKTRFGRIKLRVEEFTSDTEDEMTAMMMDGVDIVVATPERFDAITRNRTGATAWFNEVGLICIDEVHLVGDARGACLEAIVSRMKMLRQMPEMHARPVSRLRFIAASATIPNVHEIGAWLGEGTTVKNYGSELRPVPLTIHVEGYRPSKNDFLFQSHLVRQLPALVRKYYTGRPMLVFCGSRKLTVDAANQLLKDLGPTYFLPRSHVDVDRVRGVASGLTTRPLAQLLACGIGYHNAALEASDRAIVEREFSARVLGVVCTTTSLALGVNLPANLVVVCNTRMYSDGTYEDIDSSSVLQMIGRAGRPGLDSEGIAVIMTKAQDVGKFQNISTGNEPVESQLLSQFPEHLNAEIAMGSISNVEQSMSWLMNSFLYVRIFANPTHYNLPRLATSSQIKDTMMSICKRNLENLRTSSMISVEADPHGKIASLEAGKLMARYYMNFKTMKSIVELPEHASLPDLLSCICRSQEVKNIRLRRSEKSVLNRINESEICMRFPVEKPGTTQGKRKKVQEDAEKVRVLINEVLSDTPTNELDPGMRSDADHAISNGRRISRCMFEYFSSRESFAGAANALMLSRSFVLRLWENTKHVTRQLGMKVGIKLSTALVNVGIDSLEKVLAEDTHRLETLLGKAYPFGSQLQRAVTNLPPRADVHVRLAQDAARLSGTVHVFVDDTSSDNRIIDKNRSHAWILVGCPQTDELFLCRRIDMATAEFPLDFSFSRGIRKTGLPKSCESVVAACIPESWIGLDTFSSTAVISSSVSPARQHQRLRIDLDAETPAQSQQYTTPRSAPPSAPRKLKSNAPAVYQISIERSIERARSATPPPVSTGHLLISSQQQQHKTAAVDASVRAVPSEDGVVTPTKLQQRGVDGRQGDHGDGAFEELKHKMRSASISPAGRRCSPLLVTKRHTPTSLDAFRRQTSPLMRGGGGGGRGVFHIGSGMSTDIQNISSDGRHGIFTSESREPSPTIQEDEQGNGQYEQQQHEQQQHEQQQQHVRSKVSGDDTPVAAMAARTFASDADYTSVFSFL